VYDLRCGCRIHADRVRGGHRGRTEVWASVFLGGAGEAARPGELPWRHAAAGMTALETSRFGKTRQKNRWLLERDP
jgi:hypothetical protein